MNLQFPTKLKSRKFWTTTAALVVVFVLEGIHPGSGKNLEIIIPAILGTYHWANIKEKRNDLSH